MSDIPNEKWLGEISHKNIKIREPISDVDEVLRIARSFSMTQRVAKVPLIFRGQGTAAYRLIPSAYRDLGRDKMGRFIRDKFSSRFDTLLRMRKIVHKGKPESDIEMEVLNEIQIDFEYRVFKEFICEGDRQAIPIPEFTTSVKSKLLSKHNENLKKYWPPRRLYAALGLAQHYCRIWGQVLFFAGSGARSCFLQDLGPGLVFCRIWGQVLFFASCRYLAEGIT